MCILPPGGSDLPSPHTEDEVYSVLHGRTTLDAGDHQHLVHPGSVVCVAANLPHRFRSIEEELTILVVFAPAAGNASREPKRRA